MTILSLAGRTEARRLHHLVHRNLSRRYQAQPPSHRHASTNTTTTPPPISRTVSGPWAWIEPLAVPLRGYNGMQKRSPYLTQLSASIIIYFLGDLSAQTMSTSVFVDAPYEPIRGLRAMLIASIIAIPGYKYFLWLGNHFNFRSHALSIAVKIVVNQTFFTPIFNTFFFGMQSLLSGSSLQEAKRRVVETVPRSWVNSWKVWPAVTAINFTWVSPHNRSVAAGVVAIFWQTYLSWLNKQAETGEKGAVKEVVKEKKGKKIKT